MNDVAAIISGGNLLEALRVRKKELQTEIAETEKKLVNINKAIKRAKGEKKMYTAEIKEMPEITVMYRHGGIESYQDMDKFITDAEKEYKNANPANKIVKPPCCFVEYFSDGYQDKDIEIEYAKVVVNCGKETRHIKFRKIERHKAVCVMHKGSFNDIREAYSYAVKWAISNGYEVSGNGRERFIDGPWNKSSEEDYLTEVQLPLMKAERDNEKRKQLSADYKLRDITGGVYAIVNTVNNKRIIMSTADIKAAKERFDFAIIINTHTMYLPFAEDWKNQQGKGFEFEVIETFDKKDMTNEEFKELLKQAEEKHKK